MCQLYKFFKGYQQHSVIIISNYILIWFANQCVSFTLMKLKDLKKVKIQKVSLFEVGNGNILLLNYIFYFYFGGGGGRGNEIQMRNIPGICHINNDEFSTD